MKILKASLLAMQIIFALTLKVHSQESSQINQVVQVPPSPDAAHLGTYGEFSVNMATGSADVSIPITTLQEGGITIPITLSYQSAGLRVDERPSWVGAGWVLSAGGVISRTMRGGWDDMGEGFLRNLMAIPAEGKVKASLNLPPSGIRSQVYQELDNISQNEKDYEPDAFTFNFVGKGGSFFFGNDGNAHCVEHATFKFEPIFGSVPGVSTIDIIIGWTVIDSEGLIYTFKALEFTNVRLPDSVIPNYISSWYLTSIYNPATKASAIFTYDNNTYNYKYSESSESYVYKRDPSATLNWGDFVKSTSVQEVSHDSVKFISGITLNNQHLEFYTSPTLDPFRRLDKIVWNNNSATKKFLFEYDYFESKCSNITDPNIPYSLGCKRSRLLSFQEGDLEDPMAKIYSFEYYSGEVPKASANSQDHWGFFNDHSNSSSLVPTVPYAGSNGVGGGAVRSPNFTATQIGMLKSISYPTKGSTTFFYEQNTWEDVTVKEDVAVTLNLGSMSVTAGSSPLAPTCVTKTITVPDDGMAHELVYTYDPYFPPPGPMKFEPYLTISSLWEEGEGYTVLIDSITMDYPNHQDPRDATTVIDPGTYRIDLCAYELQKATIYPLDMVTWNPSDIGKPIARPTGGLRLGRTENRDAESGNTYTRTFDYGYGGYFVNTNLVQGIPSYTSQTTTETISEGDLQTTYTLSVSSSPTGGLSSSTIPVAYQKVTEWTGTKENNLGRVETIYIKDTDKTGGLVPQVSRHTARTKIDLQNYYDSAGNLVKSDEYVYNELNIANVNGFRVKRLKFGTIDYKNDFDCANYMLFASWWQLHSKKTFLTSPTGGITQTVLYEYDSLGFHTNPIAETTVNSQGEEIRKTYAFPMDKNPCKKDCYSSYRQELNSCGGLTNIFALEAQQVSEVYSACFRTYQRCRSKLDYDCCYELEGDHCSENFDACLIQNGYYSYLDSVGGHYEFELCQKKAFINYLQCQSEITNCQLGEYEARIELADKATALLNIGNWLSTPLEIKTFKGGEELSSTNFEYGIWSDTIPLQKSISASFNGGEKVTQVTILNYDAKGNPIELIDHKEGFTKSYLWGYGSTALIAEFKNASSSEVAYSSFENLSDEGNFSFQIALSNDGKTGKKSHLLNTKPVSKTGLAPAKRYKVSFWAKSGVPDVTGVVSSYSEPAEPDGWSYHEKIVTGISTLTISGTGSVLIDEVRVGPENAVVTTFAHTPGIGVISTTDSNNQTTYYEYDALGRLIMQHDHYHNLLRFLQYNYKD